MIHEIPPVKNKVNNLTHVATILRREDSGPVLTLPCRYSDIQWSQNTLYSIKCPTARYLFIFKPLHWTLYSWFKFCFGICLCCLKLLIASLHSVNSLSKWPFACLLFIQQVSVLYMSPDSYRSRKLLTWAWSSLKTTPPLFSTVPQRRSALFFKWWFSEAAPFDVAFP